MEHPKWHPGELLSVSGAYWKTCTLHAGVKLDVFTVIGDETLKGREVSLRLSTDADGTIRLLNALTAMGLLEKSGSAFTNTPAARAFLCKDSPKYLGYMILHHHYLMDSWSRLDEAVRAGEPVRGRASFGDAAQREAFLMGMFNNAMLMAPGLVKTLDLTGRTRLLDMGGGPGTYAIHFCMENPNLEATVYDLPTTRPFAETTIQRFGMADRIDFQEGDYVAGDVLGRYDVVWMSHILHGEGPADCRRMVQKAADASAPGGMVIIHDFILDDDMAGPLFPALFSLNMLTGTPAGRAYSQGEITEMLQAAGVADIRRHPYQGPTQSGILTGRVPV